MINVPGVAPTPLDTTGLENSFENLGRTMVDVLAIQQQTNLAFQDQIRRANDTQVEQTLAMQRTYDSMFAAVPICHLLSTVPHPRDLKFQNLVFWPLCAYGM